jgi:hypothetical protein
MKTTQKSEIDVDNHEILQKVIMFYEHRRHCLPKGGSGAAGPKVSERRGKYFKTKKLSFRE